MRASMSKKISRQVAGDASRVQSNKVRDSVARLISEWMPT